MTTVPAAPLNPAGPAQSEFLIHFCGRPEGRPHTNGLAEWIRSLTPEQRLANVLWEQTIYGTIPFGVDHPHTAVCLSESPLSHLKWLLDSGWPAWGLLLRRQHVYDLGGGPVWYARPEQFQDMTRQQRAWATRLETTPGNRSDWTHEREWRIPVPTENPALHLEPADIAAILVADPSWQPIRHDPGHLVDGCTGEYTHPGNPYAIEGPPILMLPPAWKGLQRWFLDQSTQQFMSVNG
jgi:hypothetical protein